MPETQYYYHYYSRSVWLLYLFCFFLERYLKLCHRFRHFVCTFNKKEACGDDTPATMYWPLNFVCCIKNIVRYMCYSLLLFISFNVNIDYLEFPFMQLVVNFHYAFIKKTDLIFKLFLNHFLYFYLILHTFAFILIIPLFKWVVISFSPFCSNIIYFLCIL